MLKSSVALASLSLAFLIAPIGATNSITTLVSPQGFSSPNAPFSYPGALAAQTGTEEEDDDCDDDDGPDDGKDDGTDDGKDDGTDDGGDDDCDDDGPETGQ